MTQLGRADAREPTEMVSRGWMGRFGLIWFGYWMANLVPIQLVIPAQLDIVDPVNKVRDLGIINGVMGAVALIALPVFGALCDRTHSRFGRRRVWAAGGIAAMAAGLLLAGAATTALHVGIGWGITSLGMAAASSALIATIADRVPERQRGAVSGVVFAPQAIGIAVGMLVLTTLITGTFSRYVFLAVVLALVALPFLVKYREAHTPPEHRLNLGDVLRGLWVNPRRHPDFAWAFGGRLLVNLGNAFGTGFLLYFLADGLGLPDPEGSLLVLTLIYLVFTLLATYVGGVLSDRTGLRRPFVAVSAGLQALSATLLAAVPGEGTAMVSAALLGAGYGAFMSVDQALVTQVLPDAGSRAKDLGIMNVGSAFPQSLAPLLGAVVITALGGYSALFAISAVVSLVGGLLVYRIRSVR